MVGAGQHDHAASTEIPGYVLLGVMHTSGPRVVYRAARLSDGREIILKTLQAQYPNKRDIAEIQREFRIAQSLNIDGIIRIYQLVEHGSGNLAIEMESFGVSLADFLAQRDGKPLPVDEALAIAIRLARILGELHERDVVHKNVTPRNILIDSAAQLRLTDFSIASELSREHQDTRLSKRLEGSLPYISPEQTGRMNRDLDYRTDYYSLGVTLFQLLTGQLPFAANNALEWVHRHISQSPPAAHAINPDIPQILSRILAKLMAKNPEERYQSTFGLLADLQRCHAACISNIPLPHFELGSTDVSRHFQIPQQLYGREEEREQLVAMFDDVAHGATALCLVSGYSGVGKSALVHELGESVARRYGYLVEGKFDQFQQNAAYSAIATAFRGLIEQLLSEPGERLDSWRAALLEALGPNGQLLVDLVPELELIIGAQPPVHVLPPNEAQHRFQILMINFIKVFANERQPLVIFLDDLQWSDIPTLHLVHRLVTARELNHLFVIGAYRSNALDPGHPVSLVLDQIRNSREVIELALQPLTRDAVHRLIADTLHSDPERCRPLSELLYLKAEGNPYFMKQLLDSLKETGAIAFDPHTGHWSWDLQKVQLAAISDNVLDFMATSLQRLDADTRQVLKLAACIGNSFDLKTLSIIHERGMQQTAADLHQALQRTLVIPLDESYLFVGTDDDMGIVNPVYRFHHDRVQQAAYALIDADRKQVLHLSIGQLILHHSSEQERAERLMDIVAHLNAGRELLKDPVQRLELARMNLQAGLQAQGASAYESARHYLDIGNALLPVDAWESQYDLTMALATATQQCAYLANDNTVAENWADNMLKHARSSLQKAEILSARARQYATTGRMRESIEAAVEGLSLLNIELLDDPDDMAIDAEVAAVQSNLAGRAVDELIDAAELTDPRARTAIRLLMEIFPAAFLSASGRLFPYLVLKSVNLSLRHGASPESAFAYAAYGMLLCGALNDPALGFQYGKLGVAMNERFADITLKSRVIYVYTMFVHHWNRHWSSMTPWFIKGIEAGYQSGDLLYLAYSAQDCIIWDPALDLETASREQRKYLAIVRDCEYQDSLDSGTLFLQMQLNFQGLTDGQYSLNDDSFDEARCVATMRERRFMTGIANYRIYKAEIHFLYGDHAGALEYVRMQEQHIASSMSLPQLVRFHLVSFLTRTALWSLMDDAERQVTRERLQDSLQQMTLWADNCPTNFEHLRLIMQGELSRLEGRLEEAMKLFELAIDAAQVSKFRRDEALANELAAYCLLGHGWRKAADGYLHAARYLYYRWGALRKVADLEQKYPHLRALQTADAKSTSPTALTNTTSNMDSAALDMSSVVKASQTISEEIHLEQLWRTTLQILLENAGGQRGFFVQRENARLVIRAKGEAGGETAEDFTPRPVQKEGCDPLLPVSIVNSVMRTGSPLVLDDASKVGRFSNDPYIVAHAPKSVMCIPILRHDEFGGAIYLENNLATGAFTDERVEIIKLLSAQASISMENARIYEYQARLIEAQQRFVPSQFLENLGYRDITEVGYGEHVAREMSVLFADLRDFTPLSERLAPPEMIKLLNRYFSSMGEPIGTAGGFIDSYNGDEIMALFDMPTDRAVRAGVGMSRALEKLSREVMTNLGHVLRMGVGVNSGPLVLGTVGFADRIKCGVVGDTVNLASRIEQLTKRYAARMLISEQTYQDLRQPDSFSLRLVDSVAVKGKAKPVALYEVLDAEIPERREAKESTRDLLGFAQTAYFARDFAGACEALNSARQIDPDDKVLQILSERAARYAKQPPSEDWQGFESLTEK